MEWDAMFGKDNKPSFEQINSFINNPLWDKFNNYLSETFISSPQVEYSRCSMQRGWNLKYKKKGKSLCAAYPEKGYFKVLVVVNENDKEKNEFLIGTCCDMIKNLYKGARLFNGTKWLMYVTNDVILDDTKKLIELRA